MPLPIDRVRSRYPALQRLGQRRPICYFDGPAGTQVPLQVAQAVSHYLLHHNANSHGLFPTSQETDQIVDQTRLALCDLFTTHDPDEFAFGPNMTTLTLSVSRAIAQTWQAGDEIIVTQLDHDANVAPWLLAARDRGVTVRQVPLLTDTCQLDMDAYFSLLNERTRLVAVGAASNAVGTVNPVRQMIQAAHGAGALVYVDAVHWAPHGRTDAPSWDADFIACSAYKYFGPHVGVLWGRRSLLESIRPYKVRPAPATIPDCWMTGTQAFEGIAGVLAALDYLQWPGDLVSGSPSANRRTALDAAFAWITTYEHSLFQQLVNGLRSIPDVTLCGLPSDRPLDGRAPTLSLTHRTLSPAEVVSCLAERDVYAWHGNYYAYNWAEALGLRQGAVRLGVVHYNTQEEIAYTLECFRNLA